MTEADSSPLLRGSTERTAFISYSWTSEQHRQWVLELARRLVSHGIDVILDVWHLKPGQDKYSFMERMVTDPNIKKVLVICDRRYQEKADKRKGGVGDETLLITPEVYGKVDQDKFIPIVVERDANSDPYMPAYLRSRMYIDMSVPADFEAKYQELLRDLYDVPETTPPPLGTPPAYITEEAATPPKASSVATEVPARAIRTSETTSLITTYFEAFIPDLEEFRFKQVPDEPFDETMANIIEQMKPLRDTFVWFAQRLARVELSQADHDKLHDYLEKVAQFQFRPFDVPQYHEYDWDNYRFICYELMLCLIAALLQQGKYADVAIIVDSTYFYDSNTNRQTHTGIDLFNKYVLSLDNVRKARLGLRRVSVTADMIKERAEGTDILFADLLNADLLLHYLTLLRTDTTDGSWRRHIWFPRLSPFASSDENIPILQRLVSARHFERVKVLFGVDTPDELKRAVQLGMDEKSRYYDGLNTFEFTIPQLMNAIPLDRLASVS